MSLKVINLKSIEIKPYLEEIALLRMSVFKEFPYLYEGSIDYEIKYLERYIRSDNSMVCIVSDQGNVVGASSCLPMSDEDREFKQPFLNHGYGIDRIFYFGESILLQEYRGKGFGKEFFKRREKHACEVMENLKLTTFCSVVRPESHPMMPKDYRDNSQFWQKQGYQRQQSLIAQYKWMDIGHIEETEKSLVFWLKDWTS
jgi:GNAT superfamily N-acetyltransferase